MQPEITSKLFFGSGWATCLWNKQILQLCVDEVLRRRNLDSTRYGVPDVKSGYLMALLYNHLKDARVEWNRHQPQGGETEEEAETRAVAYAEKRRLKTVQNSRKSNVSDSHDWRCAVE